MSQAWQGLQDIRMWGTQSHNTNRQADPLSGGSNTSAKKRQSSNVSAPNTPQTPAGIPYNLYLAVFGALEQAGLSPVDLTETQWAQIYQGVLGDPQLWEYYQQGDGSANSSIARNGTAAVSATGQVEFNNLVGMIASALAGQQSNSPALAQLGSQIGQQQGVTTGPSGTVGAGTVQSNVGTGNNLPNDYAFGNCTYYVASHYQLPGNLGNADTWLQNAAAQGLATSSTPQVGSIVVYGAGGGYSQYGHVAIVTAVNSDGTFVVSEMNYQGYNQVDQRTSTMADVEGFINQPGPLHGDISLSATDLQAQQENTDTALQQEFPSAVSIFEKYYGRVPTTQEILQSVGATGITSGGGQSGVVSGTPSQYASMIESAAAQYGISSLLLSAQIEQESGFNAGAVSSAGALGIAQFMPGTAAGLGVNPMDPQSAINGMAKLMSQYYQQFGSWTKALYAYNGGPGSVNSPYGQSLAYVQDIARIAGGNVDSLASSDSGIQAIGATQDVNTIENNVRGMPSPLVGMNEGQYTDLKTVTDQVSNTLLGHTATDGIIQTLWNLGYTAQNDITNWYNMQTGTQLAQDAQTKAQYNQINSAAAPILQAIYGQSGSDPNMISNIYYGGSPTPSAGPSTYQPEAAQPTAAPAPQPAAYGGQVASQILRSHRNG